MTAIATPPQDVGLRNGLVVSVRLVEADDEAGIFGLLTGLCKGSRRLRLGFAAQTIASPDEVEVEFSTSRWRAASARFEP